MSTKAEIDIVNGKTVVHLYLNHDGYPDNVICMLQQAAKTADTNPLNIAYGIVTKCPDWDMRIVAKYPEGGADYQYKVNVSETPWRVQESAYENDWETYTVGKAKAVSKAKTAMKKVLKFKVSTERDAKALRRAGLTAEVSS